MSKYIVFHNPRCTKSRNSLRKLDEADLKYEIREYLENPLSQKEIKDLLAQGDFELKELIRNKEAKEHGIDIKNSSDAELIKAIAKFPKIMQRPVVTKAKKTTIARDDKWLERL